MRRVELLSRDNMNRVELPSRDHKATGNIEQLRRVAEKIRDDHDAPGALRSNGHGGCQWRGAAGLVLRYRADQIVCDAPACAWGENERLVTAHYHHPNRVAAVAGNCSEAYAELGGKLPLC